MKIGLARCITYCLPRPKSNGGYVRVTSSCPSSATGVYAWTVSQATASDGSGLPYAQKYTIADATGYCLGFGPGSDKLNGQYLEVVTAKRDGSTGQKWNANASLDTSRLSNKHEQPS